MQILRMNSARKGFNPRPDGYVAGGKTLAHGFSRQGPQRPGVRIPVSFFAGRVRILDHRQIAGETNESKWRVDFKN